MPVSLNVPLTGTRQVIIPFISSFKCQRLKCEYLLDSSTPLSFSPARPSSSILVPIAKYPLNIIRNVSTPSISCTSLVLTRLPVIFDIDVSAVIPSQRRLLIAKSLEHHSSFHSPPAKMTRRFTRSIHVSFLCVVRSVCPLLP